MVTHDECVHALEESLYPSVHVHPFLSLLQLEHSQLSLVQSHFQGTVQNVGYVLSLIGIDLERETERHNDDYVHTAGHH